MRDYHHRKLPLQIEKLPLQNLCVRLGWTGVIRQPSFGYRAATGIVRLAYIPQGTYADNRG